MRKLSIFLNSFSIGALILAACVLLPGKSDSYIRDRVVKLTSEKGSCSGEQIRAQSGVDYILTAAHCRVLEKDGMIKATTEDGRTILRKVIMEDAESDLLLLEGLPGVRGLDISDYSAPRDHVRTFTHGAGMATYKTDGVIVQDLRVMILLKFIAGPEAEQACNTPKSHTVDVLGEIKACVLDVTETVTTALIVPGSSGGAVVDDKGDIIGVVSAGDGKFGLLVPLRDIHRFLAAY